MRRMSGRSPPFAIIGVIVVCSFLAYNLWTISAHNEDLTNELEKLQIEIKVCAAKQAESEKSGSILQEHVRELQSKLEDSMKFVEDDKNVIKKTGSELSNLKLERGKLHQIEDELKQDVEAKEAKILKVEKKLELTMDLKDEADVVIAEKDQLINKLQQQLEQAKRDIHLAYAQESIPNNQMKIPNPVAKESYRGKGVLKKAPSNAVRANAKGMYGIIGHPGIPILPQQSPDVVRNKPKYSVNYVTRKPEKMQNNQVQVPNVEHGDVHQLNNVNNVIHNPEGLKKEIDEAAVNEFNPQQVIQKPFLLPDGRVHDAISAVLNIPPKSQQHQNDDTNVLPLPPQNFADNPDTAIDEEEKNIDDPADDQDEEGKEIKHDLEALPGGGEEGKKNFDEFNNIDYEEGNERNGLQKNVIPKGENPEPRGIGIMDFPRPKDAVVADDYANLGGEPDHNEVKANDRLYETNFSNKIRNIGKI